MPFPYDRYPWLNFQELNLAYFIQHFEEIFEQWTQLLADQEAWKAATEQDLEDWKTDTFGALDIWKAETETSIEGWESTTLAALTAWQSTAEATFEAIRVQASASATAAAGSATAAQTAQTAAEAARAAAEIAAAALTNSVSRIEIASDYLLKSYDYGTLVYNDGIPTSSPPNGHLTNNAKYCRTGFIPLKGSKIFEVSMADNNYQWRVVSYKRRAFVYGSSNTYKAEYTTGYQAANGTFYPRSRTDDEAYLCVSFRRADMSNLTDSDYETITAEFTLNALIPETPQCFQSVQNSQSAVRHMMKTAETYLGRSDLWYGTADVAYSERVMKCLHGQSVESENGKYNIDCSTFATLCLRGTPYDKSRYVTYDSAGEPGNGENGITGGFIFNADSDWYPYRIYGGGELLANQIAKYAYEHGWLYKIRHRTLSGVNVEPLLPNVMCHDIRPGDLIFRSNAGQDNYYWMDIGHVMIVADIDENYIYFYEAIDVSENDEYYSPAYRRRDRSYIDANDVYFGARFPLAERGSDPEYCNIINPDINTMVSHIPSGVSPAPTIIISESGAVQISGAYDNPSDPIEYCIPFTAPEDAICTFGIEETAGISVSIRESINGTPDSLARSPDGFSSSDSDSYAGKCRIENGKGYFLVLSVAQLSDPVSVHPYLIKGITFEGYKSYIGSNFDQDKNIAALLSI